MDKNGKQIITMDYREEAIEHLFILSQLEPESPFDVRIENTILRGSDRCTFRITRNSNLSVSMVL